MSELKPCGCGGKPKLIHPAYAHQAFAARCDLCGIETPAAFDSGQSALGIWNHAMSAQPAPAGEPSAAEVEELAFLAAGNARNIDDQIARKIIAAGWRKVRP